MPRLHFAAATGLVGLLLVSCAKTSTDQRSEGPAEIIVTGAKRADADFRLRESRKTFDVEAAAIAPPPVIRSEAPSAPSLSKAQQGMAAFMPAPILAMQDDPRRQMPYYRDVGRDRFAATQQNPFKIVREAPVSTFSIDVDTASYAFVRASLNQNVLPQPAAVRTEELVNYFPYDYAAPRTAAQPFSTQVAVFPAPGRQGARSCGSGSGAMQCSGRPARVPISSF